VGSVALLSFPVVSAIVLGSLNHNPHPPAWKWLAGPGMVFLGFILLGAGYRAAGGVFRGALVGAALYVLLGAASLVRFAPPPDLDSAALLVMGWPLLSLLLLGFSG
jgi:hypothetical protein